MRVGLLVGAERHVGDQQRAPHAASSRGGQHQHLLDAHRDRRCVPEHDLGARVADEDDVGPGGVDDLPGREVVGRHHHDRLALALLLGQAGSVIASRSVGSAVIFGSVDMRRPFSVRFRAADTGRDLRWVVRLVRPLR